MNCIQAKMFCKNHGKLEFDDIQLKNGKPICRKCSSELEFGNVKPRKVK